MRYCTGGRTGGIVDAIRQGRDREGIASVDQKKALIHGITEVLVNELGRSPQYIFVVIDELDTDNWGRKGKSLTELWQNEEHKGLEEQG